jgi:thiol-disulfide isomerase/thioredoxin
LRGKVVLIDFWTYSCINCLRSLPYLKTWWQQYRDHGLVIIGVHAPEFAFEKDLDNVRRAARDIGIQYPVAVDNRYAIWQAFSNRYWPAHYLIDATGQIRDVHFGEGAYAETEAKIRQLLQEAGARDLPPLSTASQGQGVQAAADDADARSPETYIGYRRAEHFGSPEAVARDQPTHYQIPNALPTNQWALEGNWRVERERAVLASAPGRIAFRFHARNLHLVLGTDASGAPGRFRVLIDGHPPGADHGVDTAADGTGVVREQRLYQLIRQSGDITEHTFTIEFFDPGVDAYSFTFG